MADGGTNFPNLMALSDIVERWIYTKQGVLKLMRQDSSFPKEAATVCGGKVRLWMSADIEDYERDKPWLKSLDAKNRRQWVAYQKHLYSEEKAQNPLGSP
ncbi:hypothetical protein [Acetobacter orientalis]|uniref:hypothetical protein n=2 Tax=Acetobacter orientalis TaxID=146474 RepID=UPI0011697EAC|nr:hypothetical protein [Acetobacter orientalis]GBR20115.1 hypothetical protein AA0481_2042 [Acetobacter orientalis NRIC 0481]GEL62712.1 hypothetical protein AOR02nite_25540 [Acetobacter orientalis]